MLLVHTGWSLKKKNQRGRQTCDPDEDRQNDVLLQESRSSREEVQHAPGWTMHTPNESTTNLLD